MKLYQKLIFSIITVIGLLFGSITALLFTPSFQQRLKEKAVELLSEKLQTKVKIDSVSLSLSSGNIALFGLDIKDRAGGPMLYAKRLFAQVELSKLLARHINITEITLEGTRLNLYRENPDTATNYQFVIDSFKTDKKNKTEKQKKESKISFDIDEITVNNTEVEWEVKSKSGSKLKATLIKAKYDEGEIDINGIYLKTDNGKLRKNFNKPHRGAFDPGHMDLCADIKIKVLSSKKDSICVTIDKLKAEEKASGIIVDSMSATIFSNSETAIVSNLFVKGQHTNISIPTINIHGLKSRKKGADEKCREEEKKGLTFTTSEFYAKTQLRDIARPLAPVLKDFTTPIELTASASGDKDHIDFNKIRISTTDKLLTISANGYINNLSDKTNLLLHFNVLRMSARNGVKDKILAHFQFKKSMMGLLKNIGNVGFAGTIDIPPKKQFFAGMLSTSTGEAKFNIKLDNRTRYIDGSITSDSIHLGKIIGKPDFGKLAFEATFKFDIAGRHSAKRLGRSMKPLPVGYANGEAKEIRYNKLILRNIFFNLNSNGKEASGDVRIAGALMDVLCKYSFTDTHFPHSLKVRPSVHLHKLSEEAKRRRAEKKEKRAEEKALKAQEKAKRRAERKAEKEKKRKEKQEKQIKNNRPLL